ncbi:MAG: hypothetical protein J7502_00110 [Flavisolibacter sp.]|nr:hypothetical protein [Flavisolibacter sp.]
MPRTEFLYSKILYSTCKPSRQFIRYIIGNYQFSFNPKLPGAIQRTRMTLIEWIYTEKSVSIRLIRVPPKQILNRQWFR